MIGIIIGVAVVALLAAALYLKRDKVKDKAVAAKKYVKANKGKIVAVGAAASTVLGGITILDQGALKSIDLELIDSLVVYENYGINVSLVDNPYIYERQVLCKGHMPFVLKLNLTKGRYLNKNTASKLLSSQLVDNNNFKFTNIEYNILTREDYQKQIPVYKEKEYKIEVNNKTVIKTKKYLDHYDTVDLYKYVWKSLNDFEADLTTNNILIVDIVGNFKASLKDKSVDVIPHVNFDKVTKRFTKYAWWDSDWGYYKSITFDTSQIPDELHNVPILINVTDADLATHVAQANGEDIAFVDDDNSTQFYHEIEEWDSGTGYLAAWVNVTTISDTENVIGIYYGNAGCADQQDAANTWNDNYTCVLHLNSSATGGADSLEDSTGNGNDGTPVNLEAGDSVQGIAGNCLDLDAGDERISLDSSASTFATYADGSMEVWGDNPTSAYIGVLNDYSDAGDYMYLASSPTVASSDLGNGGAWRYTGQEAYNTGTWVHCVYWSKSSSNGGYVNGIPDTLTFSQGSSDGTWWDDTGAGQDTFSIGALYRSSSPGYTALKVDEFRMSTTTRSDNYYLLIYNNMNNANDGGFYTFGSEQLEPSPPVGDYNDTVRTYGIDYFQWHGRNVTLSDVVSAMNANGTTLNEATEYVAVWNDTTWSDTDGLWIQYFGDGSGVDANVETFDVIKTYMDDSPTNVTISTPGRDYLDNSFNDISFPLTYSATVNHGYNYTGFFGNITTLGYDEYIWEMANESGISSTEQICYWNRETFTWECVVRGWVITNYDIPTSDIGDFPIFETKVTQDRTWVIP